MSVYALTWLAEVLEKEGLKVAEAPGWRGRGRGDMPKVVGVMCHHTANPHPGNMPSYQMLIDGRPDLAGPLAQLGLGRDGTYYVIAAGRANHAGKGQWQKVPQDAGNQLMIGIEAEHSGNPADPWPEVQMEAYARGVAALLRQIGADATMCCGHKEYAPHRKQDPTFDMGVFRSLVRAYLLGKTPPPPIPAVDAAKRPTLRRGSRGSDVETLQARIGIDPDGIFGRNTEAALREKQRSLGLTPDGICGPESWAVLMGEKDPPAPPPAPAPAPVAAEVQAAAPAVGKAGIDLIQYYEHCERALPDGRFQAYPDPGSKDGRPWTIGWGSTGSDIVQGTVWTRAQCDARFAQDLVRIAAEVSRAIGGAPTNQNQFDAMVSFHYNTGAIATATLTKRHKAGDYAGAKAAFAWWNKNDGKVMRGLVLRRAREAELYGTPPGA